MPVAPSSRFSIRFLAPLVIALLFIFITALSLQAAPVSPPASIGMGNTAPILSGWFTVLWADGRPGTHLS